MLRGSNVKTRATKWTPVALSAGLISLVCLLQILSDWFPTFDVFKRLEWMSYDWRVRHAVQYPKPGDVATNLGAIFIDDDSLRRINMAWSYTWPWPRQLYGRLIRKLNAQGVKAVGFDILFQELHPPNPATDVHLQNGATIGSDAFLASQLQQARNVALVAFGETLAGQWRAIMPADLFRTNTWAVSHATSEKDSDGVLRRAKAFHEDPKHGRIWHLGVVMAARELGLDLDAAIIEPNRIVLRGTNGMERIIPTDAGGSFYINWSLTWNDPRILKSSFEESAGFLPASSEAGSAVPRLDWAGKLVFVGSIGSGGNISDLGTTPLARETFLVSKHWNVANSVITGQFVRPPAKGLELLLILVLGSYSALLTWRLRAPWPSVIIIVTSAAYVAAALSLFVHQRYWLPMILPVLGGLGMTHVGLVTYQVLFEQKEKRHVKQVFARLVSPEVVQELLEAEKLNLGGARRRITVLFTDLRGFTEMTDSKQEEAESDVRASALVGGAADDYFDSRAQETLSVVNGYLATVADVVKKHKGTLDKYIGDCVMAFWGAPVANDQHAVACVEAAIEAQRAIYELNTTRMQENHRRQKENEMRRAAGKPLLPMVSVLSLGTGINTGYAVVGLMGSDEHLLNYTVFGRDVNLASRLESLSGRGRIILGEATYLDLHKHKPDLASRCLELPPVTVKGIRNAVRNFEIPWKDQTSGQGTEPKGPGP